MYKRVCNSTGNIFVVGDIHGEITKFNAKLKEISFDKEKDLMLSVGDLIDRGEDSLACLRLIKEPWFMPVVGNHEQMAFDAVTENSDERVSHWVMNGASWFFSLDLKKSNEAKELIKSIADLPAVIEIEVNGKKVVICHADYPCNEYEFNKPVMKEAVIWSRCRITGNQEESTVTISGADLFIFGHTPIDTPTQYKNQLYIDTGAVFGSRELTVLKLN